MSPLSYDSLEPSSQRILLVGKGISNSISPQIQNEAFRKLRLRIAYELFEISENRFESEIKSIMSSPRIIGLNVTVPYKERIIKQLSEIDPIASAIGAVNTVKISNSESFGFNTDCYGVSSTLESLRITGSYKKRAIVLGAGGAARACVYVLAKTGFHSILVLNRTLKRARTLSDHFNLDFPRLELESAKLSAENFRKEIEKCDLLINAITSPIGDNFPIKVDLSRAKHGMKLFDLGYREHGLLFKTAQKRGIKCSDGVLMLVEQAARSFEIWTRSTAPRKEMMSAAKQALKSDQGRRIAKKHG